MCLEKNLLLEDVSEIIVVGLINCLKFCENYHTFIFISKMENAKFVLFCFTVMSSIKIFFSATF